MIDDEITATFDLKKHYKINNLIEINLLVILSFNCIKIDH